MFLFWNRFPWFTCYNWYSFFVSWSMASFSLSLNRKPSLGFGIRNFVLTFCRCCMAFFVYISLLLRFIKGIKKVINMSAKFSACFGSSNNNNNDPKRFMVILLITIIIYFAGLWFDPVFFVGCSFISSIWLFLYYLYNNGYLGKSILLNNILSDLSILFKITLPVICWIGTGSYILIIIRFLFCILLILYINKTISFYQSIMVLISTFISNAIHLSTLLSSFSPIELSMDTADFSKLIPKDASRQSVVDIANQAYQATKQRPPAEIANLAQAAYNKTGSTDLRGSISADTHHQSIFSFEEYAAVKILMENEGHRIPDRLWPEHYGAMVSPGPITVHTVGGRNSIRIYGTMNNRTIFREVFRDSIRRYKELNNLP